MKSETSGPLAPCIYAVDIGSPKKGLAWARLVDGDGGEVRSGTDLVVLADKLTHDIADGRDVALGFEAPMFLPVSEDPQNLTRARDGEAPKGGQSRPWSVGAGAYAATVAVPIAAWVLRQVRGESDAPPARLIMDPTRWPETSGSAPILLLWEAFVSGAGHAREPNEHGASDHEQDAATAALAFRDWSRSPVRPSSDVTTERSISTVAAAALWAGWSEDVALLHDQALVLWPSECLGRGVRHD